MIPYVLKSGLLAFVVTLFCVAVLAPVAQRIGLTDEPGGRKRHQNSTPVIGGIAIFFGFCFGLLTLHISLSDFRGLIGGCGLLLLLGIADDLKDTSQSVRLMGQLLAAFLIIIWGGYQLNDLGNIFFLGPVQLGLWGVPLTLIVILCYINAFNMIDGQDGLAGSIAFVQLSTLVIYLYCQGLFHSSIIAVIAATSTLSFLCLNMPLPWRKHARVFLGDAGSTILAYVIIWFSLQLSQSHVNAYRPIDIIWVISYPVFDCVQVVIYRLLNGKSPMQAGREHLHHILLELGLTRMLINIALVAFSLALIALGWLLHSHHVQEGVVFMAWLACLLIYIVLCNCYLTKHVNNAY